MIIQNVQVFANFIKISILEAILENESLKYDQIVKSNKETFSKLRKKVVDCLENQGKKILKY